MCKSVQGQFFFFQSVQIVLKREKAYFVWKLETDQINLRL